MTSIYRTAYPYFLKKKFSSSELATFYTLSQNELDYIKKNICGDQLRLSFSIQLKVFQNFGYFPELDVIPPLVMEHILQQLTFLASQPALGYEHNSALRRHRDMICQYLNMTRYRKQKAVEGQRSFNPVQRYALNEALIASQVMNQPAYLTEHIQRFGIYFVDLNKVPKDHVESHNLALWEEFVSNMSL